jgi:hypothetical protein
MHFHCDFLLFWAFPLSLSHPADPRQASLGRTWLRTADIDVSQERDVGTVGLLFDQGPDAYIISRLTDTRAARGCGTLPER